MAGAAQKRGAEAGLGDRVDARVGAAERLPFADGSFDAVVSTLSAHHWSDVAASVNEQLRVLRQGGNIWIFDLRRAPAHAVAQRLEQDSSVTTGPVRLGRVVRMVLVRHRPQRI